MVNPHNISNVQLGLQIDLRTSVQHEDLFSLLIETMQYRDFFPYLAAIF